MQGAALECFVVLTVQGLHLQIAKCWFACRALLLVASFAAASSFAMFVPYFALGQLALFAIQVRPVLCSTAVALVLSLWHIHAMFQTC